MSIALYDDDFRRYVHVPFNLELMKLATYYKRKNEIVVLTPSIQKDRYSTTFLRKDYDDGIFIPNPSSYPNLITGGLAYSSGRYIPMDTDIERCCADTSIYSRVAPMFCKNQFYTQAFKTMTNAIHLRLSLDGTNIWSAYATQLPPLRNSHCLFLHDPNLGEIEGARDVINSLLDHMPDRPLGRRVGSKFPIVAKDGQDLLAWTDFRNTAAFYSLQYDGIMDDEVFHDFVLRTRGTSISYQLIYNISAGARYATDDFLMNGLPRIFKQIIFSRSHKLKIRLYYDDDFFLDPNWKKLMSLWQIYATQPRTNDNEFFLHRPFYLLINGIEKGWYRAEGLHKKQDVIEVFNFVRENNYELFKLFYDCTSVTLKGGNFENDTNRD